MQISFKVCKIFLTTTEIRRFFIELIENNLSVPVIVRKNFNETLNKEKLQIFSSIDIGGVFCDGFGDGIFLTSGIKLDIHNLNKISFAILQATRTRISKTEYISCPSCGRTLFDHARNNRKN